MMAEGRLDVKPLISHRFALERAKEAYALVGGTSLFFFKGKYNAVLINYPNYAEKEDFIQKITF